MYANLTEHEVYLSFKFNQYLQTKGKKCLRALPPSEASPGAEICKFRLEHSQRFGL